jgi:DNA-binding transcriptional regulator YiaG
MNYVHVYTVAMKTKEWTSGNIRDLRKRLNLFQKDFGRMIGVTERYVIYLEKGLRKPSKTLQILLSMIEGNVNEKGKEK